MIRTLFLTLALSSLLSGCIAVPVDDGRGYGNPHHYDRNGQRVYDRDRDGVPNSQDRRPDDPRRY